MGRWLDEEDNSIRVYEPVTERYYYFQPRKSNPNKGYIKVKGADDISRSVAGENRSGTFITNPKGKNALAILSQEMIDLQLGTTGAIKPENIPVTELGPPESTRLEGESVEEMLARFDAMRPKELDD